MRNHRRPRPAHAPTSPARPLGPPTDLVIETMGGEGDGVGHGPDGKPIYAPFSLPGETVSVIGAGERRELAAVLVASPQRVAPACAHFGTCGGCALQHWEPAAYLAWKVERLRGTLALQHLETEILPAFAAQPGTRRRLALHARKGSREAARLGFKERRSWAVVDIRQCPIADPRLEAALPALRRLAAPLFEHHKSAPSLHVTLTGAGLDIEITGVEKKSGGLSADARMTLAQTAAEADFARVTIDGEAAYMSRQPVVRLGPATVALPPGAFLQATPQAEAVMTGFVTEAARGAHRIADLYCGVGTFTFGLASLAPVLAAEGSAPAVAALTGGLATAPGLKGITAVARDLVRRPVLAGELKAVDVAVFDPPRAGAAEQTAELARSKVARVIGVSCNPATFARDARTLVDAGFSLTRVLPVDQFLWSPHVELVGVFER